MDATPYLSLDESRVIDAVVASLSKNDKFPVSLDYLLQGWRDFVIEIDQGYDNTIFDYTNNLSGRDLLERLLHQVPQALHSKLFAIIRPLDSQFIAGTREIQEPLLPALNEMEKLGYWWYRVPKKLDVHPSDFEYWKSYYT